MQAPTPTPNITFKEKSFHLAQTRPFSSLPGDVIDVINIVTLDPRYPPRIVGSYKYIVHEYPADIDLFEPFVGTGSLETVGTQITTRFKEMVTMIEKHPLLFLGDFKAGRDSRYELAHLGDAKNYTVKGYKADAIRDQIRELYNNGLLDESELKEWLNAVADNPSIAEYVQLEKLSHDKATIRWSAKDIKKGVKILPGNIKLTLKDAINQQSVVKIDVWMFISNKFTEVTNWFMLSYQDENKITHLMSAPLNDYKSSLIHDVEYYASPLTNNHMKSMKRLWNYAILRNDHRQMIKLYPLFCSAAAKMYQILGEIDIIQKIIDKYPNVSTKMIATNIDDWKLRLGTIGPGVIPIHDATSIFNKLNACRDQKDIRNMLPYLSILEEKLTYYVNLYVQKYVKVNDIQISLKSLTRTPARSTTLRPKSTPRRKTPRTPKTPSTPKL